MEQQKEQQSQKETPAKEMEQSLAEKLALSGTSEVDPEEEELWKKFAFNRIARKYGLKGEEKAYCYSRFKFGVKAKEEPQQDKEAEEENQTPMASEEAQKKK